MMILFQSYHSKDKAVDTFAVAKKSHKKIKTNSWSLNSLQRMAFNLKPIHPDWRLNICLANIQLKKGSWAM